MTFNLLTNLHFGSVQQGQVLSALFCISWTGSRLKARYEALLIESRIWRIMAITWYLHWTVTGTPSCGGSSVQLLGFLTIWWLSSNNKGKVLLPLMTQPGSHMVSPLTAGAIGLCQFKGRGLGILYCKNMRDGIHLGAIYWCYLWKI